MSTESQYSKPSSQITQQELTASLVDEIRRIADRQMRREPVGHTLQATAVANEAWLRLAGQRNLDAADRGRYLAAAANTIRRVLIDHARNKQRLKRGGPNARAISLHTAGLDVAKEGEDEVLDLLALDKALDELQELSKRAFQVVEMRYFAGMTSKEVADELKISLGTVNNDWKFAKSWLCKQLEK